MLTEAGKLNELANQITGKVRGPLSVGCLVTFAQMVLPQLRHSFIQAYPEVDFTQIEHNQVEIFASLRSAKLDIALTYDLDIPSDLSFIPLVTLPPYAVMPPSHPLAQRDTVTPADLAEHPMILLDLPLSSDYFLSHFTANALRPHIVERTRDMAVMQSMVANGFGYSIANIRPLTDAAPDGRRLRFVPLTGSVRPMKLGLATGRRCRHFADRAGLHRPRPRRDHAELYPRPASDRAAHQLRPSLSHASPSRPLRPSAKASMCRHPIRKASPCAIPAMTSCFSRNRSAR